MNKKGSLYIGILFAFFFFMFGMLMLPLLKDGITSARSNVGCSLNTISDGVKLVCLELDAGIPYYIIGILSLIGGFIGNEIK